MLQKKTIWGKNADLARVPTHSNFQATFEAFPLLRVEWSLSCKVTITELNPCILFSSDIQQDIATKPIRRPRRAFRMHQQRARRTHILSFDSVSPSPAHYDGLKVIDRHRSPKGVPVLVEMLLKGREYKR